MNTTEIATLSSNKENISQIVQLAPQAFETNGKAVKICTDLGNSLLSRIQSEGMSDSLDVECAEFIARARKAVKNMNLRRAPVTKLFDLVRSEFTALENAVDVSKSTSIPFQIQQHRNAYAARKREEELRRQREEAARQAAAVARSSYREECMDDYRAQFDSYVISRINELTDLNNSVTIESYQAVFDTVSALSPELPADWNPRSGVRLNPALSVEESRQIASQVFASLSAQFHAQFRSEVGDYRQEILDRLPSRRAELERAAKASAEEKTRIEAEVRAREAAEFARREQERIRREQEQAARKEVERAAKASENLFDLSAPSYQPKAKVSKKIILEAPEAIMQVLAMWWSKEGSALSLDELSKIFKKQISFCEKEANRDGGELIVHPSVRYVEEVKAK